MYGNQLNSYRNNVKMTLTGRDLEAAVLSKCAVMLKDCQDGWQSDDISSKLNNALSFNQRVWSFLQTELANPENPMPSKLKSDLLSLSIFIDKRTFDIMAYPAPEKLTVLININLNIAAGLRIKNDQPNESVAAAV